MNCVYFVMSGAVEILRSATQEDMEREFSGNTSIEHSFTVDIDESLMLDCSVVGDGMMPIGAVNGRLHIDRLKVCATLIMLRGDPPTPLLAGWLLQSANAARSTVRCCRCCRARRP